MTLTSIRYVVLLTGLALCGIATAQPSGGFYLRKNPQSGKVLCSQTRISPDWVVQSGPFKDKDCTVEQKQEAPRTDLPANPLDLTPKQ